MLNLWVFLCSFGSLMISGVFANVVLRGNGVTLSFTDIAANFARPVNESGEHGTLFLASPLDACSPLTNTSIESDIDSPYVLIVRGGGCSFKDKVLRAQDAGFKAAIIYNNDDSFLVASIPLSIDATTSFNPLSIDATTSFNPLSIDATTSFNLYCNLDGLK